VGGEQVKTESFIRGTIILTAAGIIVKILGAIYRIPFTRLVGSEGLGLYQMAYPIYATLLALSTSGVPVAISLLVAEKGTQGDPQGARQVFLVSLVVLFFLGLALSFGLWQAAPYLASVVLGDARAYYPLICAAPAVLVISVASAFRGYFQGWQLMWPTALSQVVEQLVRVGTVIWAAFALLQRGVEFSAAGATFGAFTGGCAGLLVLVLIYWWFTQQIPARRRPSWGVGQIAGTWQILKQLLVYAIPVSAGSLVMPLVQTIDTVIIPHRLRMIGYSAQAATSAFGELSGMASTLAYLPAVFTVSLANTLVPHLASASARGNGAEINRRISSAMRITIIICLPAAVGLAVLATPIMKLLFDDPHAGPIMAWLAPAAFFSGLQQTTSGALLGLGNTWLPVINMLLGCAVKIACNYYLTTIPTLGVIGAALGSTIGIGLTFFLNYCCLRFYFKYRGPAFCLPRPLFATVLMGISLPLVYRVALASAGKLISTCAAILCGMAVYFSLLIVSGEIRLVSFSRFIRR
jgi:stage V sporulation protein B